MENQRSQTRANLNMNPMRQCPACLRKNRDKYSERKPGSFTDDFSAGLGLEEMGHATARSGTHILIRIIECPRQDDIGQRWQGNTCPAQAQLSHGPLCYLFIIFLSCFIFLGPHPQHMEVLRLGVEWELQPLAYTTATTMPDPSHVCNLHRSSLQHLILNEARDIACNLLDPSLVCYC